MVFNELRPILIRSKCHHTELYRVLFFFHWPRSVSSWLRRRPLGGARNASVATRRIDSGAGRAPPPPPPTTKATATPPTPPTPPTPVVARGPSASQVSPVFVPRPTSAEPPDARYRVFSRRPTTRYRVLPSFSPSDQVPSGCYRVLLGFIGFYWVFTGFYWVSQPLPDSRLPGNPLTFYWVLPSFFFVMAHLVEL